MAKAWASIGSCGGIVGNQSLVDFAYNFNMTNST